MTCVDDIPCVCVHLSLAGVDYCIKKGGKKRSKHSWAHCCMWMDHVFQLVHPFCTLPHCVQTRVQLITSHGRESRQHVAPPDLFSLSNSRCGAWLWIVRKGSNWLAASCSAFWALWREVRPALAVGPLWLEHDFASCLKDLSATCQWMAWQDGTNCVLFHVYFLECDASTEA